MTDTPKPAPAPPMTQAQRVLHYQYAAIRELVVAGVEATNTVDQFVLAPLSALEKLVADVLEQAPVENRVRLLALATLMCGELAERYREHMQLEADNGNNALPMARWKQSDSQAVFESVDRIVRGTLGIEDDADGIEPPDAPPAPAETPEAAS